MKTDFKKVAAYLKRDFYPDDTIAVLSNDIPMWWSWGPSEVTAIKGPGYNDEKKLVDKETYTRGLIFHVQGRKHTGYVLVTLGWMDIYEVNLFTEDLDHVLRREEVYVDVLAETVDELVET